MDFVITEGLRLTPVKVVLYGPEGIGKSTFAAQFPNPLFIDTEDSTKMLNVRRFQKPASWDELLHMIDHVTAHPDLCSTLVIDTADWAERLCEKAVCVIGGKKSIEDFGYGKGYTIVAEEFGKLLDMLTDATDRARINVVLTAHSIIRKFERPDEMGAYDRYELKLGNKAGSKCSALVKEWCDMLLFANYKEIVTDVNGKKKAQGGRRVMYTNHHPCWDAKNRVGLKDELDFSYDSIASLIPDFNTTDDTEDDASEKFAESMEAKPVSNKEAVEIEQNVMGKTKDEAVEAVKAANNAEKEAKKKKEKPKTRKALTLQEKVLANAQRDGLTASDLEQWAIESGSLARDKENFPDTDGVIPLDHWPEQFIKDVIIPYWKDVAKAAKIEVPF